MFPFTGLNVKLNLQPQRQDLILKQIQLMKTPLAYLTEHRHRRQGRLMKYCCPSSMRLSEISPKMSLLLGTTWRGVERQVGNGLHVGGT